MESTEGTSATGAIEPPQPSGGTSLYEYLAEWLIARQGYRPSNLPELEPLKAACDDVLVASTVTGYVVACLVNCTADPSRQLGLGRKEVMGIAMDLRRTQTGFFKGRPSVHIRVLEVGRSASSDEDRGRLRRLSKSSEVTVDGWTVDAAPDARVWTGGSIYQRLVFRRELERALKGPRLSKQELFSGQNALPTEQRFPAVTVGLLAVLCAIFVWQKQRAGWTLDLKPQLLVAEGGVMRSLVVDHHEWWRLVTAPLLHAGVVHILSNGIALGMVGLYLENFLGRTWFLALFVLGSLGGSALSIVINPPNIVSVGASGAIMTLFAGGMVVAMRLPAGFIRRRVQYALGRVLVPSLLPLATNGTDIGKIDYGAHFGGAIVGVVVGIILYKTWPREQARPPCTALARGVSIAGILLFGTGLALAHHTEPRYRLEEQLIPEGELPASNDAYAKQVDELVAKYPRDPRPRLFRAARAVDAHDFAAAEQDARAALAEKDILADYFKPDLALRLDTILAMALEGEGRHDDALEAARPACSGSAGPDISKMAHDFGLCDR